MNAVAAPSCGRQVVAGSQPPRQSPRRQERGECSWKNVQPPPGLPPHRRGQSAWLPGLQCGTYAHRRYSHTWPARQGSVATVRRQQRGGGVW